MTPINKARKLRQIEAYGYLLKQKIGERGGRLADREARMRNAVDHYGAVPQPPANHRYNRTTETRAQYRDIEVHFQ
jgi:hypothetical protein